MKLERYTKVLYRMGTQLPGTDPILEPAHISHDLAFVFEPPTTAQPLCTIIFPDTWQKLQVEVASLDDPALIIENTAFNKAQPWPKNVQVQGIQYAKDFGRPSFVEAFWGETYTRAEAQTVPEAEALAFEKYTEIQACSHGPYESRGYDNGSGFCTKCGQWFMSVC